MDALQKTNILLYTMVDETIASAQLKTVWKMARDPDHMGQTAVEDAMD